MKTMFVQSNSNAHTRHLTNRLTPSILPLLAGVLLAGLAVSPADRARAQATEPDEAEAVAEAAANMPTSALGIASASWRTHFGEQAAEVLRRQGASAEQAGMQDLIAVAKTGQRGIDLSAAVAPLLQVAEGGSTENHRIMALQTLQAIGPEHSSELLYEQAVEQLRSGLSTEPSERVRRVTRTVINGFYLEESK